MNQRRPVSDFQPIPEGTLDEQVDAVGHPDDLTIQSPADAAALLAGGGPSAVADEKAEEKPRLLASADGERRRAWLTVGRNRDDRYVIHWSGTPDSTWDYVTMTWDQWVNGVTLSVIGDSPISSTWQWVSRGNSHETNWTRADFESKNCADMQARYVIWDGKRGQYVIE